MAADFSRAPEKIPLQLRERPGTRFTVILNGSKKPEGKDWSGPNGANYGVDDPQLAGYLSQGHNYGVLTGINGLVVLDVDDLPRLEVLGIIGKLPDTFTVKTGRGGLHLYLNCPGLTKKIVLEDPVLKNDKGKPLHLGELQTVGQFVVGPGSRHPNGNFYEVVKDLPIATIDKGDLMLILAPVAQAKEEQRPEAEHARRRSSGGSSAGDLIPIDQVAWPKAVKERAGAEVRGSHPLHGSDTGKNFSINTAKNCWHCFRHNTGGGPLEWLAIEAGLISCQDAKPGCLDKETFKKAVKIARDKGFDIPDRTVTKARGDQNAAKLEALGKEDQKSRVAAAKVEQTGANIPAISTVTADGPAEAAAEQKGTAVGSKKKAAREEFPDDIKAKALEVLQTGDPIRFVVDSCGRMVLGAENAFRKLICCVSVQNVRQSAGLHPKLSGSSSGGKSWTAYVFMHHLPREAVVKGSMSAKAVFYHHNDNRIILTLDDYQAGNEDLDTIIKQTTTEFHEPFFHRTVIKQKPVTLEIGSEQTWLITSVENVQDIQVLNRAIPINVDDSAELTQKVNSFTIERYGKGETAKLLDDNVLICRAIFQILRDADYINVRVPFYDRIEWIDTSNRRNPSIFMDLVIAHTAMFRYQRERDAEGFYLATEEDFEAARELFTDNDGEELVKRFTKKEREVLEFMASRPDGVTVNDLVEKLKISRQRTMRILLGENGKGGLSNKVTLLKSELSEMVELNEGERRTIHATYYRIANYDRFGGFDAVVRLKSSTDNDAPGAPDDAPDDAPDKINNKIDSAPFAPSIEREREKKRGKVEGTPLCGENSLSLLNRQKTVHEPPDSEKGGASSGAGGGAEGVQGVHHLSDADISAAEPSTDQQDAARDEHFKTKASEVAGPGLPAGEPEQAPPGEEPPGPEAHPDSGPHEPVEKVEPIPRPHCYLAKVRGAAIIEYGYSGWVDPAKVAKAAGILECQACRALLHLGYEQFERQGGGIGFRQKTAAVA